MFEKAIIGMAVYVLSLFVFKPANYKTFEEALSNLNTPKKLAKYNGHYLWYSKDSVLFGHSDYWQSPEEFFNNKKGDCEDFAIWNWRILKEHGYNPQIILLKNRTNGNGHVIVKFTYKGKIRYIGSYFIKKKIDGWYETLRIMNQPFKEKIKPLSIKRKSYYLEKDEMITIPILKDKNEERNK